MGQLVRSSNGFWVMVMDHLVRVVDLKNRSCTTKIVDRILWCTLEEMVSSVYRLFRLIYIILLMLIFPTFWFLYGYIKPLFIQ
ncbi:hypothetical protein HanRHA438_Chr01g0002221 [Helianthus annuus]|nr:hypothetical protein HanIR_Chr01g0002391 [Helianthus annuus]KAJ0946273.1 hypothetical protein HanRHA438_Chr01g0002221 [Helianthus annuus]